MRATPPDPAAFPVPHGGRPRRGWRMPRFVRRLGPGLITGAADDDPSGVATYASAGAAYGYGMLWTAPVALPLMAAVQLMCARIGMVTGRGLAGVLRVHYPRWVLGVASSLLLVANVVNIGADLGAMGAVTELLTGIPSLLFVPLYAGLILWLLVFESYPAMARVFKWLTLVLFAYVLAAFLARPDWGQVLRATLLPRIRLDRDSVLMIVALFGTTISPYLFFWQASEEVEEEKAKGRITVEQRRGATERAMRAATADVLTGMTISVVIFYFIVLTTGATLHAAGQTEIATARDAAAALRPLAGDAAALLFSLGIIGTGLLGVSVLAGSTALGIAEGLGWDAGMSDPPARARPFYAIMAIAVILGAMLDMAGLTGMRMLVMAAVVNGLLAPPLIVIILVVANNPALMERYRNGIVLNLLGGLAAAIMTAGALALLVL